MQLTKDWQGLANPGIIKDMAQSADDRSPSNGTKDLRPQPNQTQTGQVSRAHAHQQGSQAHTSGASPNDNPYPLHTRQHTAWNGGYDFAQTMHQYRSTQAANPTNTP